MFYHNRSNSSENEQFQNRQYSDFEASALFCPQCQQAMPVKKEVLLYLIDGAIYQYFCAGCGSSLGTKTDSGGGSLS